MPIPVFPPKRDGDLLLWSENFSDKITATPAAFGLTAAQAAAFAPLHTSYRSAYHAATNPNTNSKQSVIAKNQAKEALLNGPGGAWELVNIVQAFPNTTNAMRGELGLRIPDTEPTPVPPPETAPDLSILATMGRTIQIRLRDQENPHRRGKPDGVQGATVLYHVSEETPPNDPAVWTFLGNTSQTLLDVEIPQAVAAGSKVWLTAFWFNARKQSSPAAAFEFTRISDALPIAA